MKIVNNKMDAINGSHTAEHSLVEAPLHSPRWSRFFTIAAVAALFLNLWANFVGPYLVVKRGITESCV